jgi:Ca-activated chloride channel family protein
VIADITFHDPARLWLLLAVAGLLVAYVVMQGRRRKYAVRFTNITLLDSVAPKRPGWRRHLPAAALLLAVVASVVGFARPNHDARVPRERATIVLAIDTSLSMQASDVSPTRIQAAKVAAKAFLKQVPATINVGLVSFDGVAKVDVAPTTDRTAVASAIDRLELGEGTAIGEAVFASLEAIKQVPPPKNGKDPAPARIVLMSDGSTTVGRPNQLGVDAANKAKVPISTIAFGTQTGTITIEGEAAPIAVPVNEGALQDIADQTQGKYFRAVTQGQLTNVYKNIGSSVGFTTQKREITVWFVGLTLVFLFAAAAMSLAWFARLP